MAAPTLTLGTAGNDDTAPTSVSVNLPSGTSDKLIFIAYIAGGALTPSATSWTLAANYEWTTGRGVAVLYRAATSETSVSVSLGSGADVAWVGASTDGDVTNLTIPAKATGTGSTPDPPDSGTLTSGDYRVVALCGWGDARRSISSYPTNYSDTNSNPTNDGNNEPSLGVASRGLTSITSENPGTFSINGGSHSWVAATVVIPTAGGTEHTQACDATTTVTADLSTTANWFRTLDATTTVTAALATVSSYFRTLAATSTVTAALTQVRSFFRTLDATTTATAAVVKKVTIGALEATSTFTADLTTALVFSRLLEATSTITAALTSSTTWVQALNATTTFTADVVKKVSKTLAVSSTVTAALTKGMYLTLEATTTVTAALNEVFVAVRSLDVSSAFTAALSTVMTPAGPEDTVTKRFNRGVATFGRELKKKRDES